MRPPLTSSDGLQCFSPHIKSSEDIFFSGRQLKDELSDITFSNLMDKNLRIIKHQEKNKSFGNEWFNREFTMDLLNEVLGKLRNASSSLDVNDLHSKMIVFSGLYFHTVLIILFNRCFVTSKRPWPGARALFIKKPLETELSGPICLETSVNY